MKIEVRVEKIFHFFHLISFVFVYGKKSSALNNLKCDIEFDEKKKLFQFHIDRYSNRTHFVVQKQLN